MRAALLLLPLLLGCDPYAGFRTPHGEECLTWDGFDRCWDSHAPEALTDAPLVIDMHGYTGDAENQRARSGFEALSDTEGFVIAWPYGLAHSWNAGPDCCGVAAQDAVDDVGFLRQLVTTLLAAHPIDPDRVYVTGLSNGCAMTQRFAVEASDVVAAAACMSMMLLVDPPADAQPVPFMELHGTDDAVVAYEGGDFPSAQANIDTWAAHDACTGEPDTTWSEGASSASTWLDCADDVEVSLVTIDGGSHALYAGEGTDTDTTGLAWEFLRRFSR